MNEHTYVYSLHIAATPEKVWAALTENISIQAYWGGEWRIETEWTEGSAVTFYTRDGKRFSEGRVLASDRPRHLVYSWPNPPEEQGDNAPEELDWRIENTGPGTVKLSLTHRNLTQEYYDGVSGGWPAILSSLKTLIETGSPLRFDS
ncbi:MAG: SRPBCC domain-containing protein [Asticcacaulis sp.]